MGRNYLDLSDDGVAVFAANFGLAIEADPLPLGLTPAAAEAYRVARLDYEQCLRDARDGELRGPAWTLRKNQAKRRLVALTRGLPMSVTHHVGVDDAQRQSLGLRVKARPVAGIGPPDEAPRVHAEPVPGRTVRVTVHAPSDAARPRPDGSAGTAVVSYVGPTPPSDAAEWKYEGNTSGRRMTLQFAADLPPGTRVWVAAHYFTARGLRGPASLPASTWLGGDGVAFETAGGGATARAA